MQDKLSTRTPLLLLPAREISPHTLEANFQFLTAQNLCHSMNPRRALKSSHMRTFEKDGFLNKARQNPQLW